MVIELILRMEIGVANPAAAAAPLRTVTSAAAAAAATDIEL